MPGTDDLYQGREQTAIKHFVLQHYLKRFAHIIGHFWNSITYVDGFSGPWNTRSDDLRDSSFSIALDELRKARAHLEDRKKSLRIRCFFVEKDRRAFAQLERFANSVKDAEVKIRNEPFEASINDIREFIGKERHNTFPFVFIDPTGWTGYRMSAIAPLLRQTPSETLINFMTGHIIRFIEREGSREGFEDLFGSPEFGTSVEESEGRDREDVIVQQYCENLKNACDFKFVCAATVFHPQKDRTHHHLVYGTRNLKGVEEFKRVEKQAMAQQESLRAAAEKQRLEEEGYRPLFPTEDMPESLYYSELRSHYIGKARNDLLAKLHRIQQLRYDAAFLVTARYPLVWESDLKEWIAEWRGERLQVEGLRARERVPKLYANHFLVWRG
jgi:three-Cys-motif partner protein